MKKVIVNFCLTVLMSFFLIEVKAENRLLKLTPSDYFRGLEAYKDRNFKDAFNLFKKAADQGYADAEYKLGLMYFHGQGILKDDKKASELFKKAADQGLADAQYSLGVMYFKGQGVPKDYKKASELYKKAADQGLADAQYYLGVMYIKGDGVPKDNKKALFWITKAADQGFVPAKFDLEVINTYGKSVNQNHEVPRNQEWISEGYKDFKKNKYWRSLQWFLLAANHGSSEAQFQLCKNLEVGYGGYQDKNMAREWCVKASENGLLEAQTYLGLWYIYPIKTIVGQDLKPDYKNGLKWLSKAANQNHSPAQFALAREYLHGENFNQNYEEAFKWFSKSANQGHAEAQNYLGSMYQYGLGISNDYEEAFKWFSKSAQQGNVESQYKLFQFHYFGFIKPKDTDKAVMWAKKAALNGSVEAQYDLGLLYYNGEDVPQDYKNALASFKKAARWDHAEALFMIGIMQEFGKGGFLPNHAKAVEDWYIKAAELCNVKAIEKVKRVEENGFSLEVNYQHCPGLK